MLFLKTLLFILLLGMVLWVAYSLIIDFFNGGSFLATSDDDKKSNTSSAKPQEAAKDKPEKSGQSEAQKESKSSEGVQPDNTSGLKSNEQEKSQNPVDSESIISHSALTREASKKESGEDNRMAHEAQEDDLTKIKGIGPVNKKRLYEMGITRFEQIASWGAEDIAKVDEALSFKGRIERESWVEQAKQLSGGDS